MVYISQLLLFLSVSFAAESARQFCDREDGICPDSTESKMGVREFTDGKIKEAPVVVFSKSYCPYCKATKELFKSLGIKVENMIVIELDEVDNGSEIQDYLKELTGGRSVPRVFIGGKSLGGNDDTQAAHKANKLVPMIKAAGGL